jgi:DNA polymerase family A
VKGKDRLSLTGLDKLEESASLIALREQVDALLPRIDLTDAILENPRLHGICRRV